MTHDFDKQYWDDRWRSGAAHPTATSPARAFLARETRDLDPGTALDAGCGTGGEAIWLAEQGWQVTAADISAEALAIAAGRASASGAGDRVHWVEADLSTWEPDREFDLVTTHYAHPASSQLELYERLAGWVAPGGTLLVVGHLHGAHHVAEAAVTAADVAGVLPAGEWTVVTAEESHHDVVVRATRCVRSAHE